MSQLPAATSTPASSIRIDIPAALSACRVELQASFGALLDRTSSLELGAEPGRRPEFVIRGLRDLPVVLTP